MHLLTSQKQHPWQLLYTVHDFAPCMECTPYRAQQACQLSFRAAPWIPRFEPDHRETHTTRRHDQINANSTPRRYLSPVDTSPSSHPPDRGVLT